MLLLTELLVLLLLYSHISMVVNPGCACAVRVTVVGSVCVCACLLSHISPQERLFVLKLLSRSQQATEVKNM